MSYQLHLLIEDDLRNRIQAYADLRGISLSAAVRVILSEALTLGEHPVG